MYRMRKQWHLVFRVAPVSGGGFSSARKGLVGNGPVEEKCVSFLKHMQAHSKDLGQRSKEEREIPDDFTKVKIP